MHHILLLKSICFSHFFNFQNALILRNKKSVQILNSLPSIAFFKLIFNTINMVSKISNSSCMIILQQKKLLFSEKFFVSTPRSEPVNKTIEIKVKPHQNCVNTYGASLEISQSKSSFKLYKILSCKRLGLPCQNSIS